MKCGSAGLGPAAITALAIPRGPLQPAATANAIKAGLPANLARSSGLARIGHFVKTFWG
jgi:hypothetical protein